MGTAEQSLWDNVVDAGVDLDKVLEQAGLRRSPEQLATLERFRAHYKAAGLLPGQANPPLWDCCPRCDVCWSGLPDAWKTRGWGGEWGGITLPWIGPEYHESRVAVLADNLRNNGALLVEQQVVSDVRKAFAQGRKRVHGTVFAYRSTTGVAALIASQRGEPLPEARPDPKTLVDSLDACARLQTVKCAPADKDLSTPPDTMREECPDRYLRDDLELLAPRRLVALGAIARDALRRLFPGDWIEESGLVRGSADLGGERCEIFCVAHPSARGHWWASWWALTQALA